MYKFIDLFAGIGGFHMAFHNLKAKCVFAAEWDENARKTYEHNFKPISPTMFKRGKFVGDINSMEDDEAIDKKIPKFHILAAGFPCQPFSQAGFKRGFEDTRGTLFFKIAEIIRVKKPDAIFLENVRGLLNHNNGETFAVIKRVIEDDLGYSFYPQIIKACDYGLPQLRPRLYIVGFKDKTIPFKFPDPIPLETTMSEVWGAECSRKIGFTLRVGGRGSKITDRRNWDAYMVDGKMRRLSPEEGKKMQGFPSDFAFPVSHVAAMKQLGNSVAVNAIQAVGAEIIKSLNAAKKNKAKKKREEKTKVKYEIKNIKKFVIKNKKYAKQLLSVN